MSAMLYIAHALPLLQSATRYSETAEFYKNNSLVITIIIIIIKYII